MWTIERDGGTIKDVLVTFLCSYSLNGIVVPNTLSTDGPYEVVIPNQQSSNQIRLYIANSAFLTINGRFEVVIDSVKLVDSKFTFLSMLTF